MFSTVQDRLGYEIGCVDWWRVLRFHRHEVLRMTSVRRIDRARLDQRYRDRSTLFFKLKTKCVGVTFDSLLRGAVRALDRNGHVRENATDVDQRAASASQVSAS